MGEQAVLAPPQHSAAATPSSDTVALKEYAAIIVDAPWRYEHPRALVGNDGRGAVGAAGVMQVDVESHYPTMSISELKALYIPAARNYLLFLWATAPFLADGSEPEVAKAWAFMPHSVLTWAKVQANHGTPSMRTGSWFRSAAEYVIFAINGDVHRPPGLPPLPTWFAEPRLLHSVKPGRIHEYAEIYCPHGPWLEMFARRPRLGWDVWGREVGLRCRAR